ncbi:retrovirus-related Pol polyprotein from transposon TNT 1-94 [Trichonephila clavipes]|nr:retrovirus-related Pol polyprotein from transposon TNT 1-94 [Trichonephila clavipes]
MKDYIDIDNLNYFTFETCDISKVTRTTHHIIDISQSSQILELFHADLCGPINIESYGATKYFMTTSPPQTDRIQLPVLELNHVQNQIPVKRSERLKHKQISVHLTNNAPTSYFEAKNRANWQNWKLALENELDLLDKHKIWEIVEKPAKSKLMKTKWTAYVYGDLEETVHFLPRSGFEKLVGDDKVCKLKKSIYGLPQSGRNWYGKIKGELENISLKQLACDNFVFIKSDNQSVPILCAYVDDLAIFCNNDKMYDDIVSKIKNVFEVVETELISL